MCSYGTVGHQPFISVNGIVKAAFYDIYCCPQLAFHMSFPRIWNQTQHWTCDITLSKVTWNFIFAHKFFFQGKDSIFFSIVNFVRTTVVGWNSQSDLLATDQSQLFCLFFYLKHIKRAGFHGKRIIALRITFRVR